MRNKVLGALIVSIGIFGVFLVSPGVGPALASGIALVSSVCGQVGAVNIPFTTTDISTPANPSGGNTKWYTKGGGFCSLSPTGVEACTGGSTANQNIRSFGGGFDGGGSALTAPAVIYFTVPFACVISAWNITVDTGTATFDIWQIATGPAIPTIANTIVAAAPPAISTGTAIHSATLTGWTTTSAANDVYGVVLSAVSGATKASLVVECDAH